VRPVRCIRSWSASTAPATRGETYPHREQTVSGCWSPTVAELALGPVRIAAQRYRWASSVGRVPCADRLGLRFNQGRSVDPGGQ
jgi:hypothetical protein